MATPEEFARLYGPAAARAGQALGVAPEILLGQFGLETGWGKSVVPGTNNLGNIKDFSGSGVAATDNMTGSRDRYRQYESPEAFFDDYVSLIQRKYPAAVGAGDDAEKFGRALKFGGYAEDPAYVPKVASAAGMVRNLGDKLAEFLIPAAHAGTLPTGKIDPALVKWDDDAIDPAQVVWDEPGQGAGAGQTSTAIGPDGVMRVSMAHEGAPQAGAPAPERTMLDRVGRQVGLTARAGVSGLTGLASMGTNAAVDGINAMFGTEIPRADVNATLSAIGLPEPENATERVAQDVVGGMAGAGGVAKLAQTVSNPLVNTVGQRVASLLGTAPGMQVASAAAGAGAAGAAREGGAGAGGQLVAGLAGGLGPALASAGAAGAVRGLVRGGEAGRQRVADAVEEFARAGTAPTVGQATGRPLLQGMETVLSQSPGSAGVMARKAASQTDEIAGAVDKIVGRLAPRAGAVEAGESISRGLEGFKAGVKNLQGQLYDRLDDFLPPATPIPVDRTRQALAALNADIKGAPALSKMFKNGRIQGIEKALKSDLGEEATTLPYEAIKKLRTLVGKEIDNATFVSDVPRDKWRALYSALSDDLGDAAREAGPDAFGAWRWANQFTRQQMGRLDDLASVAGRDTPEKIFNAAMMGTADGDTILQRVVSALPKTNRRDLAAAVVKRMGRATAGNQNDAGDAFSTSTFLTNWNKLSPEARSTLFGRIGEAGLTDELMNLAKVSSNIRDGSRYLANPSGTAPAAARQAMLGAGALAAATAQWPALGAMMTGVAGTNAIGRIMASPSSARWLAEKTGVNSPSVLGGLQALFPKN